MSEKDEILAGLKSYYGADVVTGKGGFFVKGVGHVSLAKARKITGVKATNTRSPRAKSGGYGDYAWMRKIVGR